MKKGPVPLHQIEEAFLWFGEVYRLGPGEDGSEPMTQPVSDGDGLDLMIGSGDDVMAALFSSGDESVDSDASVDDDGG